MTPGTGNTRDVCSCKLFTLADNESEQIVSERLFPLLNCKRVNPHWAINTLPFGTRRWNSGMQRHDLIGRQPSSDLLLSLRKTRGVTNALVKWLGWKVFGGKEGSRRKTENQTVFWVSQDDGKEGKERRERTRWWQLNFETNFSSRRSTAHTNQMRTIPMIYGDPLGATQAINIPFVKYVWLETNCPPTHWHRLSAALVGPNKHSGVLIVD